MTLRLRDQSTGGVVGGLPGLRGYRSKLVKVSDGPPPKYRWQDEAGSLWGPELEYTDIFADSAAIAAAEAAPTALDADLATRSIGFVDEGSGEGHFTVGGVPVSGTLVPPAATWSGVAGKPFIRVTDSEYGAVGDGVANDTAAIAAALAVAQERLWPIYFPAGTYLTDDIVDDSAIDWIGDGSAQTTIKARAGSIKLLDVSDGGAAKRMSGLTLHGNGVSATCLDSSWPTVGVSLRHTFRDLYIDGYQSVGWVGDNNHDCDINHVVVAESDGDYAGQFHGPGGDWMFSNCFFIKPIKLSCQIATFSACLVTGIEFDAEGWNVLSVHGGYYYANPVTHNNFDVADGISLQGAGFFGVHVENSFNDGHIFGGAGVVANVNGIGGHWFGVSGTTPAPKIADATISTDGPTGLIDLVGVFIENLDISDTAHVNVSIHNVDIEGFYRSRRRFDDFNAGSSLLVGPGIDYSGPGPAFASHMSSDTENVFTGSVSGDANDRFFVRADGAVFWGSGSAAVDAFLFRSAASTLYTNASLTVGDGTWNGGHLLLGAYHLWMDGSGRLRVKSSAPSSATDGTVVGTQS